MEKAELQKLDIPQLTALYLAESERLNHALLEGTEWEQLTAQRKYVTTIGAVIDTKKSALKNALVAAEFQVDILLI